MKKNKFLIVLLFTMVKISFSQEVPEFVSQTPEAAALSKYSEFPVSNFTGIPSINVPLYTVTYGDISLPIGLNYHAGGFKVSEESSWVGLGWTLSINGAITRSVVGVDDFNGADNTAPYHEIGATPNTGQTPWIVDIMEGCLADNCSQYGDPNAPGGNGFDSYSELLPTFSGSHSNRAQVGGQVYDYNGYTYRFDWEPDVYSINIMGISGKFVLDQHQNVYFLDKQDIEVTKTANGWKVRSNDGFQYYFDMKETTINDYGKELNGAWYITKIVSPTGREMNFIYDEDEDYSWQHSYSENSNVNGNYIINPNLSVNKNFTSLQYKRIYLSQVVYTGGRIELERDQVNLREDLKGGEKLKGIKVYSGNNLVKDFSFVTSYFDTGSNVRGYFDSQFMDNIDYSYYTKRLKLDEVIEGSSGSAKSYHFNYSDIGLPNKDSYSVDHWGYFNGESNGRLIPSIEGIFPFIYTNADYCSQPYVTSTIPRYVKYPGSDRKTDSTKVKANILEEIIYPTGGKTTFEFEVNDYDPGASNEYEYVDYSENVMQTCKKDLIDTFYESTSMPFDFPSDVISVHDPKVNVVAYSTDGGNISFTSNEWFEIDSPGYYQRYYFDGQGSQPSFSYLDTNLPNNMSGPITLNINIPESINQNKTAIITFSCRVRKPAANKKFAGGLRVKKITHTDGGKSPDIVKSYEYGFTGVNNEDYTYGKLKVPVRYWTGIPNVSIGGQSLSPGGLNFSSSVTNSLSYLQNSHIGYTQVTENIGENGEGGKNIYNYTNSVNIVYQDNHRPAGVPNTVAYFLDGKLDNKKVVDNQGNTIMEDIYNYTKLDEQIVKGIYQDNFNPCDINTFYGKGRFHYYPIYSRWVPMTSHTHLDYRDGVIQTTKQYTYNVENLLLSEVTTSNSKGEVIKTKTYYATDVANVNSLGEPMSLDDYLVYQNLKRKHSNGIDDAEYKTSIPIQVETYKNDSLVSRQRTVFDNDWPNPNIEITLPKSQKISKGSANLEDRIVYHNYDSNGNPLEVSKADGTHIYYIWGYNGKYPIAKIENFTSSQASTIQSSLIDPAISASNNDTSLAAEDLLRTKLNDLRNNSALSEAMVTTYTYDPLIGVTSVTDPRNQTIYYEYDDLNRLVYVRDTNGKLLSENKYHYKGQ